jgi:2,4-dienoyl-CoA reductase-like NADH-dependent reductase (Old Yellow Enzyme family)
LGRRGEPYADKWLPTIAPSAMRETLHRSFPKQMDEHDIRRVVKAYAAAVRRCQEGGLDGVETLAGGHLIGQFLSPSTNHRTDKYGGSLENRCRFGLMVFEEIRKEVGDDYVVGMRYVIDEGETGLLVPPGDAPALARAIRRLARDPVGARAIADAGYERVHRDFSWETITRRWIETYRAVLAPRPSQRPD